MISEVLESKVQPRAAERSMTSHEMSNAMRLERGAVDAVGASGMRGIAS